MLSFANCNKFISAVKKISLQMFEFFWSIFMLIIQCFHVKKSEKKDVKINFFENFFLNL